MSGSFKKTVGRITVEWNGSYAVLCKDTYSDGRVLDFIQGLTLEEVRDLHYALGRLLAQAGDKRERE